MGTPKLDGKVGRNEFLSFDRVETYAIAFSDYASRVHTALIGYIPETGSIFYYPSLNEHLVEVPPKWLLNKLGGVLPNKKVKKSKKGSAKSGVELTRAGSVKEL